MYQSSTPFSILSHFAGGKSINRGLHCTGLGTDDIGCPRKTSAIRHNGAKLMNPLVSYSFYKMQDLMYFNMIVL